MKRVALSPSLLDVESNHDVIRHLCQALYEIEYRSANFGDDNTEGWVVSTILDKLKELNADQRKTIRGLLAAKKTVQAVPHQVAA